MQEMNFVHSENSDQIGVTRVGLFPGDDILLLGGSDDDRRLGELLLRHLRIACEFADLHVQVLQTIGKVADHFLNMNDARSKASVAVS